MARAQLIRAKRLLSSSSSSRHWQQEQQQVHSLSLSHTQRMTHKRVKRGKGKGRMVKWTLRFTTDMVTPILGKSTHRWIYELDDANRGPNQREVLGCQTLEMAVSRLTNRGTSQIHPQMH